VHVGFVEAGHDGCAARIDDTGRGTGKGGDHFVPCRRPSILLPVTATASARGGDRIHGEDAGVADNDVGGLLHG